MAREKGTGSLHGGSGSGSAFSQLLMEYKRRMFHPSAFMKVNQVGYLPDAPKIAYVGRWLGSFPDGGAVSADMKAGAVESYTKEAYYAEAGKGTQEERENARLAAEAEAEKAAEEAKAGAANATRGEYDSLAPYTVSLLQKGLTLLTQDLDTAILVDATPVKWYTAYHEIHALQQGGRCVQGFSRDGLSCGLLFRRNGVSTDH